MIWCRSKINRLNNNGIKVIFCVYNISTSSQFLKESLKNASNFKSSSQKWLLRQINDSYVKKAKAEHYRCRSAFKLLEINEKYKILRSGQTVVDLGCAPGSWTQVAVKATRANVPDGARARMIAALNGRPVNVVLSDMAPSASGIKSMDHSNIIKLCYSALTFAKETSAQGGSLVMKAFDGSESKQLVTDAKTVYEAVHIMRPQASRKESSEIFFVCLRYKGITPPQQGTDEHNSDIQNVMTHGNDSGSDRGL
ncbi:rRNA methyltransferase 2, mitochondrial isoform X2 [Homalodisca vitripennis]|uniref:rRNA methyltransferase 2, mitochondrial isoform X2 n=1 Tax=Homalodisca vitripennis TaxID=197043 RepID=UPI001EEC0814|nr:rRNA methyltransferase 2, mitochondrial isoform X2 [Homalodisca vitripennis]